MNWDKGFTARYSYMIVDPSSWRDLEAHDLISGSVSRSADGLMDAADMTITDLPADGEVWVRIYLHARQNHDGVREALFTGLMSTPGVDWDGSRHTYNAECYSVLKPASDVLLPRGWYARAGANGAAVAAELLGVGPAPVEYEDNAPALTAAIVAENSETNLSMAQKVVNAIGWRIRITGQGIITILPKSMERVASMDPIENDIIELEVKDTRDWFSVPNVMRVVIQDRTAIARDEDPGSPYSITNRGREVWMEDSQGSMSDGESIESYAMRRLQEEQSPARICEYTRRYWPDLYPGDAIQLHYPEQQIDGLFWIRSQKIDLGYAARTSEECEIIVVSRTEAERPEEDQLLIDNADNLIVTDNVDCILI